MKLSAVRTGLPLVTQLVELAVAFLRMMVLTHLFGPFEFGFASALAATYATAEQITTCRSMFCVFQPAGRLWEAVAAAHP